MIDLSHQLPALQVLLPLLGAPLCFLLRRESWVSILTIAISWACLAISVTLLGEVRGGEIIVYEFGGWARPIGIEYRVDLTNAFVPTAGQSFNIINSPSSVGTFDVALMPGFPDDRFMRVNYSAPSMLKNAGAAGNVSLTVDSLGNLLGFDDPSAFDVTGFRRVPPPVTSTTMAISTLS